MHCAQSFEPHASCRTLPAIVSGRLCPEFQGAAPEVMDDPPLHGGKFMLMWTSRDATPRNLVGMEMYFSMESRTRIRYRNFLIVSHDGTFCMSYVTALTSFECQSKPPRSRRGSLSRVGAQGTIFRARCKHGLSPLDRLVGTRRGPLFSSLAMEPFRRRFPGVGLHVLSHDVRHAVLH